MVWFAGTIVILSRQSSPIVTTLYHFLLRRHSCTARPARRWKTKHRLIATICCRGDSTASEDMATKGGIVDAFEFHTPTSFLVSPEEANDPKQESHAANSACTADLADSAGCVAAHGSGHPRHRPLEDTAC
ncbi:hypothetical protein BLNAU_14384 [Blattamonas nauphoetae]|uniref:Secreted protein n=1 Tax=Blattamonas nauphoetae TaxID=2049346 RepID=A0ABQ9XE23_9EUKA|nr:hypothetical protein BLNAU_14384 [Blattamonas nauphoetae]